MLSAAWTASLAGANLTAASADEDGPGTLPDGTVLPASAIEAPASVGDAVTRAAALTPGSASSIPQAALSAYQRAEAVINKADRGCAIPWELIAAIGRVESDHGRYGGNTLDDQGVARPGIYGIALNGKNQTQSIADTDGGQYDNDTKWDRAVGPMKFIPSTWTVVGVDGDSDGTRNPQDIDDAALATAVYLCSGDDDLSEEKGQRASVYRYNHSNDYVDLVLSIMQSYMDGDFSAVPTSVLTSGVITPETKGTAGGKTGGKGGATGGA
ncbi:MAG TPA: lytic murein transglycosylase, partial [Lapillicoccus sp.]|nr:lytic murein transglycosylase [Lapillicoccus sp.]